MTQSRGSALFVAMVAVGLVGVLAATVWRASGWGFEGARSSLLTLNSRLLSEAAVHSVTSTLDVRTPALPLGGRRALPTFQPLSGSGVRLALFRTARETYLVDAQGVAPDGPAGSPIGGLLWALDPGARVASLPAAVSSAVGVGVAPGAGIHADSVARPPSAAHGPDCRGLAALVDSLFPTGRTANTAVDIHANARLGLLDPATLAARADILLPGGSVTPGPLVGPGGACARTATSWGDPDGAGACARSRPLIVAAGDVTMVGGVGQGIVVVQGSIDFTSGARFDGLVLAQGEIRLSAGARVRGFLRSSGRVQVSGGATVLASACPVLRALENPGLAPPLPVPGGWIEPM